MMHKIKLVQPYFERSWSCEKTFEVRVNDRDYQKGDTILLMEYDKATDSFSGREIFGTILYVLFESDTLKEGTCVFSFSIEDWIEPKK